VAWELGVRPAGYGLEEIERALTCHPADGGPKLLDVLSHGCYDAEPVNDFSYSPVADACRLSERFPEALFTLTATNYENFSGPEEPGYQR
jgi:hypothetical protein